MSLKEIVIQCSADYSCASPIVIMFGSARRVLIVDKDTGDEREVFRGEEFDEAQYKRELAAWQDHKR